MDDDVTDTVLDPALLDALRQVRELTQHLPAGVRSAIATQVSRIEDRSYAAGETAAARSVAGENLGTILYGLHADTQPLLGMLDRNGRLWQPEPGRAHPDVERLPLLAARIVAAAMHQPEPREEHP